jgi:DNA (cytosine-5)-methyltransferase 1
VAGKQKGLAGNRSGLFFQFIRILKERQPAMFIWENVKGTLSSMDGWDFARMQIEMAEAGYSIQWQILNAKDFGVPQSRQRIFVIGHLGRECPREVFFEPNPNAKAIKEFTHRTVQSGRIYARDGISPTLDSMAGGLKQPKVVIPVLTPDRVEKRQNGRRFKTDGEPSFTLTSQDRHGIYDGVRIRKITPKECERLMGLPDDWTRYGIKPDGTEYELSDSARYKLCGNGVVVNVVQAVFESLKELL